MYVVPGGSGGICQRQALTGSESEDGRLRLQNCGAQAEARVGGQQLSALPGWRRGWYGQAQSRETVGTTVARRQCRRLGQGVLSPGCKAQAGGGEEGTVGALTHQADAAGAIKATRAARARPREAEQAVERVGAAQFGAANSRASSVEKRWCGVVVVGGGRWHTFVFFEGWMVGGGPGGQGAGGSSWAEDRGRSSRACNCQSRSRRRGGGGERCATPSGGRV